MNTVKLGECKEQIIKEYIPLVKYIASRVMFTKNKYMEYEDLVSYGMIGLIDALNKFDSTKGMKFSSYASIRNAKVTLSAPSDGSIQYGTYFSLVTGSL